MKQIYTARFVHITTPSTPSGINDIVPLIALQASYPGLYGVIFFISL